MKYIEVEIRIFLDDDSVFFNWLNCNSQYIGQSSQKDVYYQPIENKFIFKNNIGENDADKWLRIRTYKGITEVCYKHWHRDPKTNESLYADEVETIVSDEDAIRKMFVLLGYEEISTTDKTRDSWIYGNFKIERDVVKGLGKFYEIEFHGEIDDPEKGRGLIFDFLQEINIAGWKLIDRGYPWMQWNNNW